MALDDKADRFSKGGLCVSVGLPAILISWLYFDGLFRSLSGFTIFSILHVLDFMFLLVLVLTFVSVTLVFLIACLVLVIRMRWCRALSFVLLPVLAAPIVIWLLPLAAGIDWAADFTHYSMFRSFYAERVDATPVDAEPRLVWFFWRDASALLELTLEYLVYDQTDEISLPDHQRSAAFGERAVETYRKESGFVFGPKIKNVRHLTGHYYVVDVE
jgi:hypothetical protein